MRRYVAKIEAEANALASRRGLDCRAAIRGFAEEFVRLRKRGDDRKLHGIGIGILWTCFAHPQSGERMRKALSAMMRRGERVHITWRFSRRTGLAISLAGKFIDMEKLAEAAPKDAMVMFATKQDDEGPPQ
jgi:hypothetical protein